MSTLSRPSPATTNRLYELAKFELTSEREPAADLPNIPHADRIWLLDNKPWLLNFLNTALPDGYSLRTIEPYWFVNPGPPLYEYLELQTPDGSRLCTLEIRRLELLWHERLQPGPELDQAKARYEQREIRMPQISKSAGEDLAIFMAQLVDKVQAAVNATALTPQQASDIEYVRWRPNEGVGSYGAIELYQSLYQMAQIANIIGTSLQDL